MYDEEEDEYDANVQDGKIRKESGGLLAGGEEARMGGGEWERRGCSDEVSSNGPVPSNKIPRSPPIIFTQIT